MTEFIGFGRQSLYHTWREWQHLEKKQAEEKTEEDPLQNSDCGLRNKSQIRVRGLPAFRTGRKLRVRCIPSWVWSPGERKNAQLYGPKDEDKEDAQFHEGEGPEVHRTEGNGGEDE